ncbi:theronine dehydrogenase-like Zn-dependent dehydrogenase [Mesotoga prima MesG1.Ag.4.2]|uniref:Theronine dehydrogenase-like Zn-dependent dehydrogenase n=1 Tax=Mesotoga prima MesG1.Ag.4.2 TaxID=660470 RepID=I2F7H1_9BACT|nr:MULTISPECIES: zinc-binding alcohol dehydrogenase [Mesotoga]AFK07874.1 theronine dehydrogenase-like Zn-dependent dehydrogenase [Mesotoga prima MesG1.Ag.4.2]PIJ60643.1 alcohol dehydrogenase [Mesotoga sp. H07.pep.5.3]
MPRMLVATAPRKAAIVEYQDRKVAANEVMVEVEFASPKHGSEVADFRGESPLIDEFYDKDWHLILPRSAGEKKGVEFGSWNLGNMWVGKIVVKGVDVKDYSIGERVCSYGGIRETHIINAIGNDRLLKVPTGVSWKSAVCYDPAQFALSGIRDGNVRPGDYIAVIGLGAIGLMAVQLGKKIGARPVIGVDPIAIRREAALNSGADYVLDPGECDVGLEIKRLTGKLGADCIIETSGSAGALQSALRGLAYGGTVSYVAWAREFAGGINFGREAHYNYGRVVFSRAASEPNPDFPRWDRKRIEKTCWNLILDGSLSGDDIVNPVVNFEESPSAYCKYVDTNPELSIKLGVAF